MSQKKQPPATSQRAAKTKSKASKPKTQPKVTVRKSKAGFAPIVVDDPTILDDLTPHEKIFIEAYLENGTNGTAAAKIAWPGLAYASQRLQAHRVLKRLSGVLSAILDNKGLTIDRMLKGIVEGLSATTATTIKETIYKDGKISGKKETLAFSPDFATRHRYLEMGLKLRGALASKEPEVIVVNGNVTSNSQNNTSVVIGAGINDEYLQFIQAKTSDMLKLGSTNDNSKEKPA